MGHCFLDGVLINVTDEAKYAFAPADDFTDEAQDRWALERTRIVSGREVPSIAPVRSDQVAPCPLHPRAEQEPGMAAVAEQTRTSNSPLLAEEALSAAIREPAFRRWHNDLRIMRGIDMHELVGAGVIEDDAAEFNRFSADPYLFAIKAPDARAVALYRLIDSRRPVEMQDGAQADLVPVA